MRKFASLLGYLFPASISLNPATALSQPIPGGASTLTSEGAQLNNGALYGALQAISRNGQHAGGNMNYQTTSGASLTLTNIVGAEILLTTGSACTLTFDNAPNIVSAIPGPYQGMTFPLTIVTTASTTVATPTVTNTGVTLSGTTSVVGAAMRRYKCQITQLTTSAANPLTAGTTYTSITQIGSTNLYTLALGTNAITTVVGNLIYIGTTAGTLPAGWYPTYTAGTTSIVVALPPSGTAWTCTAASMVQPSTVPVTFAPLITVTGAWSTVTGTNAA